MSAAAAAAAGEGLMAQALPQCSKGGCTENIAGQGTSILAAGTQPRAITKALWRVYNKRYAALCW